MDNELQTQIAFSEELGRGTGKGGHRCLGGHRCIDSRDLARESQVDICAGV